jgi:hypothetical protein
MLPLLLRLLSKNFNVENKGIFPKIKYFNLNEMLEDKEYKLEYINYKNSFKNKNWNLKKESIKNCEQDCIVLYQILERFLERIFNHFKIDIHKFPTLPSLAFGIYRSNYLKDFKIPLINNEMYKDIKIAYTGGAVDIYKPFGNNIKGYEVNSLYPKQMFEKLMPVGNPSYFEGDILSFNNKPFGIFEVEIIAPENLNVPILQLKYKTEKSGTRTIAPLGNWSGWYFSEELYNAEKYGYKFKILRGFLFEKENIFKDYIEFLYNLKENSSKDSADYIIAKLLMNNLYGRFGMDPELEEHLILSLKDANKFCLNNKNIITNVVELEDNKEIISFFKNEGDIEKQVNVSVPISTAITAYARIFMSSFKNLDGYNLYYSDTDSVYLDKELDPKFIGTKLGQWKLEKIFKRAIFLGPKMLGGIYFDNKSNKYKEDIRIKGLKNPITFFDLISLLFKDSKINFTRKMI